MELLYLIIIIGLLSLVIMLKKIESNRIEAIKQEQRELRLVLVEKACEAESVEELRDILIELIILTY